MYLSDHEKRGGRVMAQEDIEQLRRGFGIRTVVKRQVDRWGICRRHMPHRPRGSLCRCARQYGRGI